MVLTVLCAWYLIINACVCLSYMYLHMFVCVYAKDCNCNNSSLSTFSLLSRINKSLLIPDHPLSIFFFATVWHLCLRVCTYPFKNFHFKFYLFIIICFTALFLYFPLRQEISLSMTAAWYIKVLKNSSNNNSNKILLLPGRLTAAVAVACWQVFATPTQAASK